MKRIFSMLFSDLHWKLLSLAIAFVLWFIGANMNNPLENRQFNIPLQVNNYEILARDGLILLNPEVLDEQIQVRIRATRGDLQDFSNASGDTQLALVRPSIDLRGINTPYIQQSEGPVTVLLDVGVNLAPGFEHFAINPRYIEVAVDTLVRTTFHISPYVVGELDSGLELRHVVLANNNVTITGPRAHVAQVAQVVVYADIWGVTEDLVLENQPIIALNEYGYDITHMVQLGVQTTTVTVPVLSVETVPVVLEIVGEVAPGFAPLHMEIYPQTIDVVGTTETLSQIEYLVATLDITGADENMTVEIDLRTGLPPGVNLRSGEDYTATVTVEIEPIQQRTLQIPMDSVLMRGATIAQILSEANFIGVSVSGPSYQVTQLTAGEISLEIDLRNLPIGVHNMPITVNLPEGITLNNNPAPLQVQVHEPATEPITEEETEPITEAEDNDQDATDPEESDENEAYHDDYYYASTTDDDVAMYEDNED